MSLSGISSVGADTSSSPHAPPSEEWESSEGKGLSHRDVPSCELVCVGLPG